MRSTPILPYTPKTDHDDESRSSAKKIIEIACEKAQKLNSSDSLEYDNLQRHQIRMAVEFCRQPRTDVFTQIIRTRAAKSLVYLLGEHTPPDIVDLAIEFLADKVTPFDTLVSQLSRHLDDNDISQICRSSRYSDSERLVDPAAVKTLILIMKDKTPPEIFTQGSALSMEAMMRGVETDLDREVLTVIGNFKA